MHLAQNYMKTQADKGRTEREFQIRDWVYLCLQPYRQKTVAMRKNMKLSPRFFGPFKILQLIGSMAYLLDLPTEARIHPVFHISCLKQKVGQHINPFSTLPLVDANGENQPKPEQIVERQVVKKHGPSFTEVLVN